MTIFNSGGSGRTNLEKVADTILWLPRTVWVGKSVRVVQNKEGYTVERGRKSSLTYWIGKGIGSDCTGMTLLPLGIIYLLSCIAALPMLIVGLPLKKVSLILSEKGRLYNSLVKKALNLKITEQNVISTVKMTENYYISIDRDKDYLEKINHKDFKFPITLFHNRNVEKERCLTKKNLEGKEIQLKKLKTKLVLLQKNLEKYKNDTNLLFDKYVNT